MAARVASWGYRPSIAEAANRYGAVSPTTENCWRLPPFSWGALARAGPAGEGKKGAYIALARASDRTYGRWDVSLCEHPATVALPGDVSSDIHFGGALFSYVGTTRFVKTAADVEAAESSEADLAAGLVRKLGLSQAVVGESVA